MVISRRCWEFEQRSVFAIAEGSRNEAAVLESGISLSCFGYKTTTNLSFTPFIAGEYTGQLRIRCAVQKSCSKKKLKI